MESVRWAGALADQPGLLQPGQGQVKEPVRPAVLQQPVAEVAQHAVVEAGIVEIEAERVLEVDPAPHRLGGVTVGQVEQELQHAHRGQLRRRDPGPPVPGIPAGEVLVRPQAVEPVPHPHRRRPGRVAGPRHPRGQLRDLDPQAGTNRHHALLRDLAGLTCPRKTGPGRITVSQTPRFPTESSLGTALLDCPGHARVRSDHRLVLTDDFRPTGSVEFDLDSQSLPRIFLVPGEPV